jgi:hypothetical protein
LKLEMASILLSGTYASVSRSAGYFVTPATLVDVAGVPQVTITPPFAVDANTVAVACYRGAAAAAAATPLFISEAYGAAGVGTITVSSGTVGDAGRVVNVMIFPNAAN